MRTYIFFLIWDNMNTPNFSEGVITLKKIAALIFAVIAIAGTATIVMAAEDFGPGENPNLQGARAVIPESYIPSPSAPVISVEEYQNMNDAMGQPTDHGRRIPAYGSGDVMTSTLPEEDGEDNVPTAAIPENVVPITVTTAPNDNTAINPVAGDATTNNQNNANNPDIANNAANNAANGAAANPNPRTGAADTLAPIMTAILSLAAAPVILKGKK